MQPGHDKVREPANRVRRHELIFVGRKDRRNSIDNKNKKKKRKERMKEKGRKIKKERQREIKIDRNTEKKKKKKEVILYVWYKPTSLKLYFVISR